MGNCTNQVPDMFEIVPSLQPHQLCLGSGLFAWFSLLFRPSKFYPNQCQNNPVKMINLLWKTLKNVLDFPDSTQVWSIDLTHTKKVHLLRGISPCHASGISLLYIGTYSQTTSFIVELYGSNIIINICTHILFCLHILKTSHCNSKYAIQVIWY